MEIKFRQNSIGWCTVYTWANLLNNPDVLRLCNDERYRGCGAEDEDEILREFVPEIKLQTVVGVDVSYKVSLPLSLVWELIQRSDDRIIFDEQVIPYLLTVRLIEAYFHHVAILKHGAAFYYCDPWRKSWMKIDDVQKFGCLFKDIWQVQRPVMRDENAFVAFDGEVFNYPFLEKGIAELNELETQ